MKSLAKVAGAFLSRNAIHTYVVLGALAAIWCGLREMYAPLAPVVIGCLMLTAVIYARTSKAAE